MSRMRRPEFRVVRADDYAREHGWIESAVIHRIRAGIYEGHEEDGTWYVYRGHDGRAAEVADRESTGFDPSTLPLRPPPRPGWAREEFPLRWVPWVQAGFLVLLIVPFVEGVPLTLAPAGLCAFGIFTVLVYEAARTGTVRTRIMDATVTRRPKTYWTFVLMYGLLSLLGAGAVVASVVQAV